MYMIKKRFANHSSYWVSASKSKEEKMLVNEEDLRKFLVLDSKEKDQRDKKT